MKINRLSHLFAIISLFGISTQQQSVSVDELKHYARFTGIAYCPSGLISSLKCNICDFGSNVTVHQVFHPDGDFQHYVSTDSAKKTVVVTFRGTLTVNNMFTNLNLTDMETGFKAFRREIIQEIQIQEDRFGFEPEITAKLARMSARFYEVGISYSGRTYAEGKKIGWKDGVSALRVILKFAFWDPQ